MQAFAVLCLHDHRHMDSADLHAMAQACRSTRASVKNPLDLVKEFRAVLAAVEPETVVIDLVSEDDYVDYEDDSDPDYEPSDYDSDEGGADNPIVIV